MNVDATVQLDVSLARAGVREAISADVRGLGLLNPGQARRLADDLIRAADIADSLTLPLQIQAVGQ